MKRYAVIMAGGSGTRFWPRSRSSYPKQFLSIGSDKSLIEETIERLDDFIPHNNIFIVINREHIELARDKLVVLPPENFLVEPVGRNTAACVALAAFYISRKTPDSSMIVLPSDHKINNKQGFIEKADIAFKAAEEGANLITFGIMPEYAETGYGYIEVGRQRYAELGDDIMEVKRFCEKPDVDRAWQYYSSGNYLWNSGMFVWSSRTILDALRRHLPKTWEALKPIAEINESEIPSFIEKIYPTLESVSIDYAVMEKAENVFTVRGDFGWSDVGSWRALEKMIKPDENGNCVQGDLLAVDSSDNIVVAQGRLVALLHIDDLIVVDSKDALLICPKEKAQDVRLITEKLKQKGRDDLL